MDVLIWKFVRVKLNEYTYNMLMLPRAFPPFPHRHSFLCGRSGSDFTVFRSLQLLLLAGGWQRPLRAADTQDTTHTTLRIYHIYHHIPHRLENNTNRPPCRSHTHGKTAKPHLLPSISPSRQPGLLMISVR